MTADDTLAFPRGAYPIHGGDRELFWGLREGMTAYLWGVYDQTNRTFKNLGELELSTLSGNVRHVEARGLDLRRLVGNYNLMFGDNLDWRRQILFKGVWSLDPHVSDGVQSLRDTVWGVFRAQNAITRSAHLHQTSATKDGTQIERHLVRTHSQKELVTL